MSTDKEPNLGPGVGPYFPFLGLGSPYNPLTPKRAPFSIPRLLRSLGMLGCNLLSAHAGQSSGQRICTLNPKPYTLNPINLKLSKPKPHTL